MSLKISQKSFLGLNGQGFLSSPSGCPPPPSPSGAGSRKNLPCMPPSTATSLSASSLELWCWLWWLGRSSRCPVSQRAKNRGRRGSRSSPFWASRAWWARPGGWLCSHPWVCPPSTSLPSSTPCKVRLQGGHGLSHWHQVPGGQGGHFPGHGIPQKPAQVKGANFRYARLLWDLGQQGWLVSPGPGSGKAT